MKKYNFAINGKKYNTEITEIDNSNATIVVNGIAYNVEFETEKVHKHDTIIKRPTPTTTTVVSNNTQTRNIANSNSVVAPLPGVILDIKVTVGDTVTAGQHIITLEAMKMENNIEATQNGIIKSIAKQRGDSVMEGETLIVIE